MERKKTKGRQKIPIKKIENEDALLTTFSKRREGLYKKASELVRECDVDIGIMMISPAGKPHSFFHPTLDAIVTRFQNPDMQLSQGILLDTITARNKVNELKNRLEELDVVEDATIAQTTFYDQMAEIRQKGWWESIEQLNADEVTIFNAWLSDTCSKMCHRLKQLENGASSSLGRGSFGV
ncbi:agamous-like MADS-box protein AGL62 [Solanum lycopersicum]|uniref:MADS-box domain-containing protein n=1 Tax=Solanum lycopersicum TaxID=4081 RepID=A0A3Q7G665_SOLLC|nr:agamous-like MADS-box protein AGL62 [Solanum lycopersicum]